MTSSTPTRAEQIARMFHEVYEELAPAMAYETRRESRTPWEEVPETNRALMVKTVALVLVRAGLDRANLGLATTRELLEELSVRFEVHGPGLEYRTVDGEAQGGCRATGA